MKPRFSLVVALALIAALPAFSAPPKAQPQPQARTQAPTLDELRDQLKRAETVVSDLKWRIAALESGQPDPLEEVRSRTWFVDDLRISNVNSVGGVSVSAKLRNPTDGQVVKYIVLRLSAFNAVHDQIRSEIGGDANVQLRFTGPLEFGATAETVEWGNVWYHSQAKCLRVDGVQVVYTSGKTVNFAGAALRPAINPSLANRCGP